MHETILALMLSLASTYHERPGIAPEEYAETAPEREERLSDVASVLAERTPEEAAAAVAIAYSETRLARYALTDCANKPPAASGDCDRDRDGNVRARSYWQLWRRTCKRLWALPAGSSEALKAAADCAVRQWRYSHRICGGNLVEGFAHYGGRGCTSDRKSARQKAKLYRRALAWIRAGKVGAK